MNSSESVITPQAFINAPEIRNAFSVTQRTVGTWKSNFVNVTLSPLVHLTLITSTRFVACSELEGQEDPFRA